MPPLRTGFILLGLLGAGLSGCIFSTREPNAPVGDAEVKWVSPDETSKVLENIRVTFNAKSVDNYNRSLSDDFTFVPDPTDYSQTGGACFSNWNKDKEVQVMANILKASGKITFTWGTPGEGQPLSVPESPEDRYYHLLEYRMAIAPPTDTVFVGKADLYMRPVNGLWVLYQWRDTRVAGEDLSLGRARCSGGITK